MVLDGGLRGAGQDAQVRRASGAGAGSQARRAGPAAEPGNRRTRRGQMIRPVVLALAVLVAGCTSIQSPSPSPTPTPTPGAPLTQAELKVRLVDAFGPLWFCDPDFFPVARADEAALAKEHFGDVRADAEALAAILAATGLPAGALTGDQQLEVLPVLEAASGPSCSIPPKSPASTCSTT